MRSPEAPSSTRRRPDEAPLQRYTFRLGAQPWPANRVGGKANGLVKLARAGMKVPHGFVVAVDAFQHAVDQLVTDVDDLAELREALQTVEIPLTLVDEIAAHLADFPGDRWAVRSSALAEDSSTHSFAGQHLTILDVEGVDAVLSAIRRVWADALSERALQYRNKLAVDAVPGGMAVVVQRMVDAEVAGVAFSVNPMSDDPTEAVVSAARGLGTAVVGGEACDTYYVERPSGYVRRSETQQDVLDSLALRDMTRWLERAERAFEGPVDLEWARIGDDFVFVQARPITGVDEVEETVWTNSNVGEALPGVATPLTWSVIRRFSRRGFERAFGTLGLDVPDEAQLVGSFAGRVYLNLTEFAEITSQIPILAPDTLFEMAGGGGVELVREIYDERDPTGFLLRLPRTIPRIIAAQVSMPVVAPVWDALFRGWCETFFTKNLRRLNHDALGEELRRLDTMFDWNGEVALACASNFLMSYVGVREVLRTFGRAEVHGREQELLAGLHVPSADPGLALLDLGRIARRSRRLRRIISESDPSQTLAKLQAEGDQQDVALFLEELARFRHEYGHRAPREAELSTPRWREDTTFLFEVLRGFIAAPHLPSKLEVRRDRENAERQVRRIVDRAFTLGLGRIFGAMLSFLRGNARRRELLRNRVVDSLDMYRRYFLEIGRRLKSRGDLARPEDVFYLTIDEIRAWLSDVTAAREFRFRVLVRRAIWEMFDRRPDPPNIFVEHGSELIAEEDYLERTAVRPLGDNVVEIRGLPASPGRVTGTARVVRTPEDARGMEPGEILILPYADVGWTPLFLSASAVVMDLGGPLSHAAIVAREYGVPAVVNARGILATITTGDRVTVDGEVGVVFRRDD
jgi:pyruvate,water dikinase